MTPLYDPLKRDRRARLRFSIVSAPQTPSIPKSPPLRHLLHVAKEKRHADKYELPHGQTDLLACAS